MQGKWMVVGLCVAFLVIGWVIGSRDSASSSGQAMAAAAGDKSDQPIVIYKGPNRLIKYEVLQINFGNPSVNSITPFRSLCYHNKAIFLSKNDAITSIIALN